MSPNSLKVTAVRSRPGKGRAAGSKIRRTLWICLLGTVLGGCDPFAEPASLMDEYRERVGRVLDLEPAAGPLPDVGSLPRRRELVRELPELDMGILEFFSLYGCELQQVVGLRNSALGKVMQPVQRLRYEIRFIRTARECLPEVTDESLRDDLAAAVRIKRQALPLATWNATWGAPEIGQFFTRSDGYLPLEPDPDNLAILEADLERLIDWIENLPGNQSPAMFEGLSDVHQRWQALPLAGQLVQSSRLLIARLGDVEALLRQRLQGRPLCFEQRPNREAEIMRNLFFNVYAEEVQPYMAAVQRVRAALVPPLRSLAQVQRTAMPDGFEAFRIEVLGEGPDSLWGRLDRAVESHTRAWQNLLDQCGMRPQA